MHSTDQERELSVCFQSISSEPAPKHVEDVNHVEEGQATKLFSCLNDCSIQE